MKEFIDIPDDLPSLDPYLSDREAAHNLKPGTAAEIIWNSAREKTEYSIVYLHGFRASHPEGNPVHQKISEKFGFNLFLSRLEEHGVASEYPLLQLTEEKLLYSARFAFEIGHRIGEKVILMGTSTGASLALWLAAQDRYKKHISSIILYSPLIRFFGLKEKLLMSNATRTLLRLLLGKKHLIKTKGTTYAEDKIWNSAYALQGALSLAAFIEHHMQRDLFSKVQCPVFTGYYFKNKREQDRVVSVPAIKRMVNQLGSRTEMIQCVNFATAQSHVICSSLVSKAVPKVIHSTTKFLKYIGAHTPRENI